MNSSMNNSDNEIISNKKDFFKDKSNEYIFSVYKDLNGQYDELSEKFYSGVRNNGLRMIKLKIGQESQYKLPYSERKTPKRKTRSDKGKKHTEKQLE